MYNLYFAVSCGVDGETWFAKFGFAMQPISQRMVAYDTHNPSYYLESIQYNHEQVNPRIMPFRRADDYVTNTIVRHSPWSNEFVGPTDWFAFQKDNISEIYELLEKYAVIYTTQQWDELVGHLRDAFEIQYSKIKEKPTKTLKERIMAALNNERVFLEEVRGFKDNSV